MYRTTNRGQFWVPVNNGLTDLYITSVNYIEGILFAVNSLGIYKSTNSGNSWLFSGTGIPQNSSIENIIKHNTNIFAATFNGVYISSNMGQSWQARNTGLPSSPVMNTIVSSGSNLVAATAFNGIYYSSNNGLNWLPFNNGMNAVTYEFYETDSTLFAGTGGAGVYKFDKNVIGIDPVGEVIPIEYRLYDNYPNPFNPVTKIRFSIPRTSDITLRIYDVKGSLAAEVFSGKISAGTHEFTWNAEKFASGVYFYKLETDNFNETKKMVLIK